MQERLKQLVKHPATQLIIWIISLQVISAVIGSFSAPGPWYYKLNRSSLTPDNWVFPVAWISLYICLAIYGWTLWQNDNASSTTRTLFLVQLAINYSWPLIFFKLQFVSLSLLGIAVLIIINCILVVRSISEKITTWFLLVPYIMWLSFAYYLTNYILKHM